MTSTLLHKVKSALTIALGRFIRRRENRRLLAQINAADDSEPTEEETALLERMRYQQMRLLLLEPCDIDPEDGLAEWDSLRSNHSG